MVHVFLGFGAFDPYLSHVADVEHAHMVAHCIVLVGDIGILDRHVIAGEGRHERAQLHVSVMQTSGLDFFCHFI